MPSKALSTVVREVDDMVFSAREVEHAKARLMKLVDAKVVVRSDQRDELGRIMYEERDDSAIQLAAACRVIEFGRGKARQMIDVRTTRPHATMSNQDLVKMALANPELAKTIVAGMVNAAKTVQDADIEVLPGDSDRQPPESESEGPQR